jgi:hypothetical protein
MSLTSQMSAPSSHTLGLFILFLDLLWCVVDLLQTHIGVRGDMRVV